MPIGRPSKLTPELIETVCEGVRDGLSYKDASIRAGICRATFHKYKALGESGKHPFADFLDALESAEAELKHRLLGVIEAASTDSWAAAGWILERKFPAEFGRRMALDHGAQQGGEFTMSVGKSGKSRA